SILIIEIYPYITYFEIFLLNNSSLNSINLFIQQNKIYLNKYYFDEYNLQILICFFNRTKCQYTNYNINFLIDWNLFEFYFKKIQPITIEENLPINSFITYIQLQYNNNIIINYQQLIINYKLLNYHKQFNLHSKNAILRLGKYIKNQKYILDIQADIYLFNQNYSIKTNVEINIYEINKYRPCFNNQTLIELYELPYQFQTYDYDENKQTNGYITYYLSNCFKDCPFEINSNNGILNLKKQKNFIKEHIYYLQIIVFDWGEPISFETKIDIKIDLSSKLIKRNLIRKKSDMKISKNQSISSSLIIPEQ
ncbi:unnamed protein product, partial [Rotaria sp. Silwood1]